MVIAIWGVLWCESLGWEENVSKRKEKDSVFQQIVNVGYRHSCEYIVYLLADEFAP